MGFECVVSIRFAKLSGTIFGRARQVSLEFGVSQPTRFDTFPLRL